MFRWVTELSFSRKWNHLYNRSDKVAIFYLFIIICILFFVMLIWFKINNKISFFFVFHTRDWNIFLIISRIHNTNYILKFLTDNSNIFFYLRICYYFFYISFYNFSFSLRCNLLSCHIITWMLVIQYLSVIFINVIIKYLLYLSASARSMLGEACK